MINSRFLTFLSLTAALAASGQPSVSQDSPPLRADADYVAQRSEPVTHSVDFRAIVTPPYRCRVLRVWMPIPPSNFGQEVSASEFSTFPLAVEPRIGVEPDFGNRFAYFEFHAPQGAQIIEHRFTARVWQLDWNIDPDKVEAVDRWPESFAPYLRKPDLRREQELVAVLGTLGAPTQNPVVDLRRVLDWVDQNLTYDHVHASLQADADHALTERRGHCSDYHGLCAAMAQSLGQPTRVTYGLSLYPKNSPSHCKLEAWLPPYGWVSFDVSETQKLASKIAQSPDLSADRKAELLRLARERLHRGFRENSWLLLTRGVDYELAPPAARPVRVLRTIYAEADGVPLPEPDPANSELRAFSWMTSHRYEADREFQRPFEDLSTLDP